MVPTRLLLELDDRARLPAALPAEGLAVHFADLSEILWTVGHGARPAEALIGLLQRAGIERVVDVRSSPGSRRHPQFGKDALDGSLHGAGIHYAWEPDLGGFRTASPESRNTGLPAKGFRGYADHMESDRFRRALTGVLEGARSRRTAVMCAESVPWRCHRAILADAVLARGWEVRHLLPDGGEAAHELHPAARMIDGDRVVYDRSGGQGTLLEEI
jgi:uncharacterized protein (DUF488 family)